jgi:hypothetical protein
MAFLAVSIAVAVCSAAMLQGCGSGGDASTTTASPSADRNLVSFGVFTDEACTIPLTPGGHYPVMNTSEDCFVMTYTDPLGNNQTNAWTEWQCADSGVAYVQYPGSANCTPPKGSLRIEGNLTTECSPVETHMGWTYQKLMNYTEPCDAKRAIEIVV